MNVNLFNMGSGINFDLDTPEGMANAVEWQTRMVSVLKQGGRWIVPRSGSIYEIDHEGKRARRITGFVPEPTITRVFEAMGWKVVEATDDHA